MTKSPLFGASVGAVVLGPLVMLWALDSRAGRNPAGPVDEAVSDPAEIRRPSAWVAFGADIEITDDRDTRVIMGKFYQDRNGSSYTETGPNPPGSPVSDDPDHPNNVITIHNIPSATSYIRGKRGVWEKHPLGVEPKQWQPKRYRYNAHVKDHAERVLGWRVVKAVNAKGTGYQLMAPDLNFAPLVWRRTTDTRRLLNIHVGDADPKLFLPPPEAEANMLDCPEPMISMVPGPPTSRAQDGTGQARPGNQAERKCQRPSSPDTASGPKPAPESRR